LFLLLLRKTFLFCQKDILDFVKKNFKQEHSENRFPSTLTHNANLSDKIIAMNSAYEFEITAK